VKADASLNLGVSSTLVHYPLEIESVDANSFASYDSCHVVLIGAVR